jgi:hypothetical protein
MKETINITDKLNKLKLAARLPEDINLQKYVAELSAVEPPDIKDPMLAAILREFFITISDVNKMVAESTQKAHE